MGASHSHAHDQGAARHNWRRLVLTLILIAAYMVAEVIGGVLANSLALLADAGHMLSDVAALGLSLFALWIARRPPQAGRTYGYYRAEILAALVNGASLVAISFYIFYEAWQRLGEPPEVAGGLMMLVATGGLLVNLAALWLLHAGRQESLNMRGAWLHVFTDTLGSVGAIAAGVLVWVWGWRLADPLISVLIGALVLYSSWGLLKESVAVLMEFAPGNVDIDDIRNTMAGVPQVQGVHDLHVWSITSGMVALSAHVVAEPAASGPALLTRLRDILHARFGIDHITIQIDAEGCCDAENLHA